MTEAVDAASQAVPNAAGLSIEINYGLRAAPGATGSRSATASNKADTGVARTVALAPAPASAAQSTVSADPGSVTADAVTYSTITVTLRDANGNPVSGKTVSLAKSGNSSVIATVSGVTNAAGQATFGVTNTVAETTTYTATDTTDGIAVMQTAAVVLVPGPVHHFSISAIAGPQTAGQPFSISIVAQDSTGNTVTNFAGNVRITSTGTLITGGGRSGCA